MNKEVNPKFIEAVAELNKVQDIHEWNQVRSLYKPIFDKKTGEQIGGPLTLKEMSTIEGSGMCPAILKEEEGYVRPSFYVNDEGRIVKQ